MGYFSPTVQFFGHLGKKSRISFPTSYLGANAYLNNCKILELASIDSFVKLM
jgi:hypothetical protein